MFAWTLSTDFYQFSKNKIIEMSKYQNARLMKCPNNLEASIQIAWKQDNCICLYSTKSKLKLYFKNWNANEHRTPSLNISLIKGC